MEYCYSYPSYDNLLFLSECANSYQRCGLDVDIRAAIKTRLMVDVTTGT